MEEEIANLKNTLETVKETETKFHHNKRLQT